MDQTTKSVRIGTCLLVPSVQELAKQHFVQVPPQYICPNQDPAPIFSQTLQTHSLFVPTVPIIDLQRLLSQEPHGDLELGRLDSACKDWGFFQLVNHGINSSLIEQVKSEVQDFFRLPMEEKKRFWQNEGDIEGFGQKFVVSKEQKLDWSDMFFMITLPLHSRKPNLLPKLPLPLRDTIESYSSELKRLTMTLVELIAKSLQIEPKLMTELFEDGRQAMRMNYYPPCPQPELVMGIPPHSDSVGLTILLELNEIEGLQIKKEGMWVPIKPIPGALLVNIGDMLEIVTNGIYQSVEHRATVNSLKERLSLATFYSPSLEREISPAPSLITPQTPALFKSIGVGNYLTKTRFNKDQLHGKLLHSLRNVTG